MRVTFSVLGHTFNCIDYEVVEEATSTTLDDTAQSVGSFSATINWPKEWKDTSSRLAKFGIPQLENGSVTMVDPRRGTITGTVQSATDNGDGTVSVSCLTGLAPLNTYNVTAFPYRQATNATTLFNAIQYYAGLAGVTNVAVEGFSNLGRTFPGWNGEVWLHLKQLAIVEGAELTWLINRVWFRPIRQREMKPNGWISLRRGESDQNPVGSVEAVNLNVSNTENARFYSPAQFGDSDMPSTTPGGTVNFTLKAHGSMYRVTSITYDVVTDDERNIGPSGLAVRVNPDDSTEILGTFSPPSAGYNSKTLTIGRRGASGERVPYLGISGSGTLTNPISIRVGTGVPAGTTYGQGVATLNSPFLNSSARSYREIAKVATSVASAKPTLSGEVQEVWRKPDVLTEKTQDFGNVAGMRYWDEKTQRWYRVRKATIRKGSISFEAEDDTTLGEALAPMIASGKTYAQIATSLGAGATYDTVKRRGIPRV